MTRDDIRNALKTNLIEITDNENVVLTDASTAADVPGWDSVNHIKLLFAIEAELGISFEVAELVAPDDVGGLIDLIQSKL